MEEFFKYLSLVILIFTSIPGFVWVLLIVSLVLKVCGAMIQAMTQRPAYYSQSAPVIETFYVESDQYGPVDDREWRAHLDRVLCKDEKPKTKIIPTDLSEKTEPDRLKGGNIIRVDFTKRKRD